MRKIVALGAVLSFVVAGVALIPPPPQPTQADYEQNPPVPLHFWVQKLQQPLQTGENIRFSVEFLPGTTFANTVDIYLDANNVVTLHDDGNGGDINANDNIFATYIYEDIQAFTQDVVARESATIQAGGFLQFTGHTGKHVTNWNHLDFNAFDMGNNMEVSAWPLSLDCHSSILKENSLFITDLSVVENTSRAKTATGGNPFGAWTFATMVKNMSTASSSSSISAKDFLKNWLRQWLTTQTVNGENVLPRESAFDLMIKPWILACGYSGTVNESNWEWVWSSLSESDILQYAPFKLTAIVNRLDLRGNRGYGSTMSNAGETRFIFTLIDPATNKPPVSLEGFAFHSYTDAGGTPTSVGKVDWEGMNVIFEYGNPFSTPCEIKNFALQWINLSSLTLGTEAYNAALQAITDQVIAANVAPSKPNGSAINQIRTNEKIFDFEPTLRTPAFSVVVFDNRWREMAWEFRQFEIGPAHTLVMVPLTNTPFVYTNDPINTGGLSSLVYTGAVPDYPRLDNVSNWAQVNQSMINIERHHMPLSYGPSPSNIVAGSGIVANEYLTYWDLNSVAKTTLTDYRLTRHNLSLNTCQGCHAGETKTIFTHVRPLAYGAPAKYWTATPDYTMGVLDTRFVGSNAGNTLVTGGAVSNYPTPTDSFAYWINVSPFLTGRNYSGDYYLPGTSTTGGAIPGSYNDDDATDANDNNTSGLYYVNDPVNAADANDRKYGYNDLERRLIDLCNLANSDCTRTPGRLVMRMIRDISFAPMPKGSH